ncbi:MAG TPA: hypothetical protein VLY46_13095 [Usitatibacter sp.]|nr:hypothetical protein [Usitatibacter sp.]
MSLVQLWLPIVVATVAVFFVSFVLHAVIQWHRPDFRGFANEDAVRAAMRAGNAGAGQYLVPYLSEMKQMKSPEKARLFEEGPVAYVTLRNPGPPRMGKELALWFVLNLAICIVAAYVGAKTLPPGASFVQVCRIVATVGFVAYAAGPVQEGIWMGKPWAAVSRDVADAILYALAMGAAFGWLWH